MPNNLKCTNPVKLKDSDIPFRCGICKNCQNRRRLEWANRLLLEQSQNPIRPYFVTCTYAPEYLPDNYSECLKFTQKWLKRVRKRIGKIRYFLVTERGTKKGRLHQHLILWTIDARMNSIELWSILRKEWYYQRIEVQPIRSIGGFYYTAKYITKNLSPDGERGDWNRRLGMYEKKGRLFTWSQKPMLGTKGLDRYKLLIDKFHEKYPKSLPPNYFNTPIFGKMERVYIPSDAYKRIVKEKGLTLIPESDTSHIKPADIQSWLEEQNKEE